MAAVAAAQAGSTASFISRKIKRIAEAIFFIAH